MIRSSLKSWPYSWILFCASESLTKRFLSEPMLKTLKLVIGKLCEDTLAPYPARFSNSEFPKGISDNYHKNFYRVILLPLKRNYLRLRDRHTATPEIGLGYRFLELARS